MKLCLTCQTCYDDEVALCTTAGHPALKEGRKGTRFVGRYRLDRLLGGGQWGTVYAGTHDALDRQDAIKLLQMDFILETAKRASPHLLADFDALDRFRKDTVQRFQREAKTAGRLTHQNLVRIYDHGLLSDDEGYISMELIEGQTLQQHIHNLAPVPCASVISIARQIAAGLKAAHKSNIIHRDLKPANIMLMWDEGELQVKVLDFGLAKLKEDVLSAGGLTASGTLLGTPYYMSPEQCMGQRDLDHRSDIYSFGVILFEMLAGHRPFEGQSVTEIALKHIREQPPSVTSFRGDLPATLAQLVDQSLRKAAEERPSSMTEILARLSEPERTMPLLAADAPDSNRRNPIYDASADTLEGALATSPMKGEDGQAPSTPLVRAVVPQRKAASKIRLYDLAKELKLDTKRLIEEVRREGVDVSVPSNAISKELAEKIREKYFPTKHARSPRRVVKVVKRAARAIVADSEATQQSVSATEDFGALLDQFEREQRELEVREPQDFGALLDEFEREQQRAQETLGQIEEGLIVEGEIKRLTEYGAFVDLGGIDGLLHVTNMSWAYVEHPRDIFKVGDIIQAKILSFDKERERISLGYKQLLPDPWQLVDEKYETGDQIRGYGTRFVERGLLVEIEWGVEGLVPLNEMSFSWRDQYMKGSLPLDNRVMCTIRSIDSDARQMTLSLRDKVW
jgi:serine/threonine-protein kinase